MREGLELACALHFQLEGALQLVGALGGCILVVRSQGEAASDLHQMLGIAATHIDSDDEKDTAAESSTSIAPRQNALHRQPTSSGPQQVTGAGVATEGSLSHFSGLEGEQVSSLGPPNPVKPTTNRRQRLVAQFRCVALSGRTSHRAFAHESMLTGVVESRVSLNIALAGEPFLVVPLQHPTYIADVPVGVLCLAYKANPSEYHFSGVDESRALVAAQMIAATLWRCPAARFVVPYSMDRLTPLGIHSSVPQGEAGHHYQPTNNVRFNNTSGRSTGAVSDSIGPAYTGLVFRSSSRAVLATKVKHLDTEIIPSLPTLVELAEVIRNLESLVLHQQTDALSQTESSVALERRLRTAQQELNSLRTSYEKDRREGDAFRLAGYMSQQRLNEHIAKSEVEKARVVSDSSRTVNETVTNFIARATRTFRVDGEPRTFRGRPLAPMVPPSEPQSVRPSSSRARLQLPATTGGMVSLRLAQ